MDSFGIIYYPRRGPVSLCDHDAEKLGRTKCKTWEVVDEKLNSHEIRIQLITYNNREELTITDGLEQLMDFYNLWCSTIVVFDIFKEEDIFSLDIAQENDDVLIEFPSTPQVTKLPACRCGTCRDARIASFDLVIEKTLTKNNYEKRNLYLPANIVVAAFPNFKKFINIIDEEGSVFLCANVLELPEERQKLIYLKGGMSFVFLTTWKKDQSLSSPSIYIMMGRFISLVSLNPFHYPVHDKSLQLLRRCKLMGKSYLDSGDFPYHLLSNFSM